LHFSPSTAYMGASRHGITTVRTDICHARTGPEKLSVTILQAHGLQHLPQFTAKHPYVTCEVKHSVLSSRATAVETKPMNTGNPQNPFWGETHTLEPWNLGDALEFTVYDQGISGSKCQGKVWLPAEHFHPHGFSGAVSISGSPHATLNIIIQPTGPSKEVAIGDHNTRNNRRRRRGGDEDEDGCTGCNGDSVLWFIHEWTKGRWWPL